MVQCNGKYEVKIKLTINKSGRMTEEGAVGVVSANFCPTKKNQLPETWENINHDYLQLFWENHTNSTKW